MHRVGIVPRADSANPASSRKSRSGEYKPKTLQVGDVMHLIAVDERGRAVARGLDDELRKAVFCVLQCQEPDYTAKPKIICPTAPLAAAFMGKSAGHIALVERFHRKIRYKLQSIERTKNQKVARLKN